MTAYQVPAGQDGLTATVTAADPAVVTWPFAAVVAAVSVRPTGGPARIGFRGSAAPGANGVSTYPAGQTTTIRVQAEATPITMHIAADVNITVEIVGYRTTGVLISEPYIGGSGGGGGSAPDATTTTKGVARLLGGTADAPTVPWASVTGGPTALPPTDGSVTNAKVATNAAISLDKTADGTTNRVFTSTEKTKLAGVATGATANPNAASIPDFVEAVQDAVAALLGAGSNVILNYDDAANSLTISATGAGGTGLDVEQVRDAIGVALVGVGNIAVTVNDAADTITISTTATQNATDAALRARPSHTGEQAISTVTGLQAALDAKASLTGLAELNALDYGVVSGAAIDNATAIADLMTLAATTGRGVYFPPGDFRFSAPIVFKAPIRGAGPNATQLRPLASLTGSMALDFNHATERKSIRDIRISGGGQNACVGSSNNGYGSSLTLFENVWFTDTSTTAYAVGATSTASAAGSLTGAVFLRCSWDNTPHMVRAGDNQDDVTFIGCRFHMIASNQPSSPPLLLRGQNISLLGSYFGLDSTTAAGPVKELIQVGAHVVDIIGAFFEVQGGRTSNLTHLASAAEPSCHLSMRDITFRNQGTSSITTAVYTVIDANTSSFDSTIELRNWRAYPGSTLVRAVEALVSSPATTRALDFSGISTIATALVTLASGTPAAAAGPYLRLNGEWRGKSYAHTLSHDAALALRFNGTTHDSVGLPPCSYDPRMPRPADFAVVSTVANTALYYRVRDGGQVSKIAFEVTASSGNISLAVYANNGLTGAAAAPGEQKATTGAIACPAVGPREAALPSEVRVEPGDWLAISSDNVNAAFRSGLTSEISTVLAAGLCYKQATAHPLPSTPSGLTAIGGRNLVLVGLA